MAKNLVIVESPAKSKTIKKILGSSYQVIASNGHVRDLPKSQLGVDLEHDFDPHYITIRGKGDVISHLRSEAKKADKIYLATDPDREGEAISWHLATLLGLEGDEIYRVTFNEITKAAVKEAMKHPRKIDQNLVDAQQARRVMDRIVGYQISPILWKKVKKGLSAGRVQNAALKLLRDREDEIADFIPEEYWTMEGSFSKASGKSVRLEAAYAEQDGKKEKIGSETEALALEKALKAVSSYQVREVKKGKRTRKAPDPFTTSTLQQEASARLNFTPQKTMAVAQMLYEGVDIAGRGTVGLISYLRTDSTRIADEMKEAAALYIEQQYGSEYAAKASKGGKSEKKEGSERRIQDAHEAIRPTSLELRPSELEGSLSKDQLRLYKLIFERFVASQMSPAEYETQHISIEGKDKSHTYGFEASGSVLLFPGFLKAYKSEEEESKGLSIDLYEKGDALTLAGLEKKQHFTQPPSRYTEALLVRALEENGIGRPSTYAPTIQTVTARGYAAKEKKALYVTELGQVVDDLIREYFDTVEDIHFTAKMESAFDQIEEGEIPWKSVIRDFYKSFEPQVERAMEEAQKIEIKDEVTDVICEKCGRNMVLKLGRFGKFYACPGFPECRNTKPYFDYVDAECPKCGARVLRRRSKKGRTYYSCENYEHCDYMSWDMPTRKKCPRCQELLYERGGVIKRLVCLNRECRYSEEIENPEA